VLGFGTGLVLQFIILLRGRARIGINLRNLRPDFALMGQIIRISFPSTVQMSLRASSRLAIIGLVGLYGTNATAGYGVASRLLLIALIPIFGLGNAAGTLVGQNLGAHQPGRAEKTTWWVSAYAGAFIAVVTALMVIFAHPLIGFVDDTPLVVKIGSESIQIIALSLIPGAIGVVLARGFDGAGNTMPAMMINLLSLWAIEVPVAFGLARWAGMGVTGIWWGRAISNLANGLLFAIWFRRGRWKQKKV
jgi:Na+-driven multidrug efflux pump